MNLQKLIRAWQHSATLHRFLPPASEEELQHAETILNYRLPESLRELYLFSNGAELLQGNLQILPLEAEETSMGLTTATPQLREWHWQIPSEVLVFGDDGSDSLFGIWLPEARHPKFEHPVLEIGTIFGPQCMAVVGTGFLPFLYGWTTFYLMLLEADSMALDAIELPASLRVRSDELDDEVFARLRKWADPDLPNYHPDPYRQGHDVEGLWTLFKG